LRSHEHRPHRTGGPANLRKESENLPDRLFLFVVSIEWPGPCSGDDENAKQVHVIDLLIFSPNHHLDERHDIPLE
jgi:hypothetical protein